MAREDGWARISPCTPTKFKPAGTAPGSRFTASSVPAWHLKGNSKQRMQHTVWSHAGHGNIKHGTAQLSFWHAACRTAAAGKAAPQCSVPCHGCCSSLLMRKPHRPHTCRASIVSCPFLACRKKVYTVLRSPHVNKDSREQFEVRTALCGWALPHLCTVRCGKFPGHSCHVVQSPPGLRAGARPGHTPPPLPACVALLLLTSPLCCMGPTTNLQVRLHQRLIDIKDLSSQTVDKLMSLDLPAGVDVEVGAAGGPATMGAFRIKPHGCCWGLDSTISRRRARLPLVLAG